MSTTHLINIRYYRSLGTFQYYSSTRVPWYTALCYYYINKYRTNTTDVRLLRAFLTLGRVEKGVVPDCDDAHSSTCRDAARVSERASERACVSAMASVQERNTSHVGPRPYVRMAGGTWAMRTPSAHSRTHARIHAFTHARTHAHLRVTRALLAAGVGQLQCRDSVAVGMARLGFGHQQKVDHLGKA